MGPLRRAPLLALSAGFLFAGIWGGLARMGWSLPAAGPASPLAHGAAMTIGFFGALIGLERAVAIGRPWAYAGPVAALLAGAALGWGVSGGPALSLAAALVLTVATAHAWYRQRETFLAVMVVGASSWVVASVLLGAGRPFVRAVPWLAAFLVLTVAGERLELSRMGPPAPGKEASFLIPTALVTLGAALGAASSAASWLFGAGLVGYAVWMGVFDVARRTVRLGGVTRYIASCLLSGYVWLGVAGVLWPLAGDGAHDAALHALFLGFVFSMVFGHAHLVAPAVLGVAVPFRRRYAVHLVGLHAGLVLRVAGDLAGVGSWRRWGGMIDALAIVGFVVSTAVAVAADRRGASAVGVP